MAKARYDYASTRPGTLAGRYMRMFWQPVFLLANLAPKELKPLRVMSEDFTIFRGEGGNVYITEFQCAHRRAQLSVGWVEGEAIRCRYHGWKYAGDGQCVEQPGELDRPFADKVRLRTYPTRVYKGLVFAYLGEGAAPPFPEYPELEGDGVLEPTVYGRRCNYFNGIDNLFDESHVAFTHQYYFRHILEIPKISYKRIPEGAVLFSARPGKGTRTRQFLMPNALRLKVPAGDDPEVKWATYVNWRVPVDDASHDTFGVRYVEVTGAVKERYLERRAKMEVLPVPPVEDLAEEILRGETTLEKMKARLPERDPHYDVYLEDHITQVGQGIVVDRERERLGMADVGVALIRELWNDALEQVANGERPLVWSTPPEVKITSGDSAEVSA
jgi:5,5'-dehydrodivanillate O-demethylase